MGTLRLSAFIAVLAGSGLSGYALFGADKPYQQQSAPGKTGADILGRVAERYSRCKTYRDRGVVTTLYRGKEQRLRDTAEFRTAFVRPDSIRFEFRDHPARGPSSRHIVWTDGESVRTRWDHEGKRGEPREERSLSAAIAGATGISGGTAHNIPRLLLPDVVSGRSPLDLSDLQVMEDESVERVPCFRIRGTWRGDPVTLWIDKKRMLIRKIVERARFPDFEAMTTITYYPEIDIQIPPSELKLDCQEGPGGAQQESAAPVSTAPARKGKPGR